ncbi:MAG: M1 family metallopeptidase [Actinobacteria bacterium]|nr:M1 family metallopeptidase [Actinomycetota bacterium]
MTARVAAIGVALALVAGGASACTRQGPATSGPGPTTTTSAPPTTSGPTAPPTSEPDPDLRPSADERDVDDPVVPGLGDPRIDVSHYDLTLRADPGQDRISGTAVLTLSAVTAEPLDDLTLDLRGPTVDEVEVDGEPARARAEGDQVVITPAAPLQPGEDATVRITYGGEPRTGRLLDLDIPTGLRHDDAGGWFALSQPDGTRTWAPVNDHPSDKATWRITLDTPTDAVGVANGRLTLREQEGGRRRWVWEVDRPMATYLAVVAVGDYDLVERAGPAGSRVLSAFPTDLGERARLPFDDLDEIVDEYSATFGPYPDDDLGVLVVDDRLGVALETQTRPLFGLDALGTDVRQVLAHELAHLWWGDAVTPATWEDLWLSEGFATYSQWLDDEQHGGPSLAERAASVGGTDVPVHSAEAARAIGNEVYEGGATALVALRDLVGDDAFDEVLRAWFERYEGRSATTEDLVALATEVTGTDLTTWAGTWLDAPQPTYRPR